MSANVDREAQAQVERAQLEQLLRRFRSKSDLYRYLDRNLVSLSHHEY